MSTETHTFATAPATAELMEQILYEVKRVVVGQDRFLERVMVAMLAGGHLLVEGVPGLAKTLTIKTLADIVRGQFKRIQFTPDLVPADLVGTRIYNQKTGEFSTSLGPVFANLLLADEINRAPAKVQSALLEVMQERQVTIAGETHKVPRPFLVMATQNPIETEGTYPLPEAQVDRFMIRISLGYPQHADEVAMLGDHAGGDRVLSLEAVVTAADVLSAQDAAARVRAERPLRDYLVRLLARTRDDPRVELGASPRAGLMLLRAAKAHAMLKGRDHVLPDDVQALALPVLTHRIVLAPEAVGIGAGAIVTDALATVTAL
ncbi:MAG: MoxR family ATPase [Conexibacter sp.]|nr:MoxR family ATPase [Conexibacter sp.]